MAKSLEKSVNPGGGKEKKNPDVSIGLDIATVLLNKPEGIDVVEKAFSASQDPATVVSMVITKIMEGTVDMLEQQGVDIDPNVWLMDNGIVDGMIEEIDRIANLQGMDIPDELKPEIFSAVVQNLEGQMKGVENEMNQPQAGGPPPQPQMGGAPPPMMGA